MPKKYSPEEGRRLIDADRQRKKERADRLGDKAYDPKRDGPKVRFTRNHFADPERNRNRNRKEG